jgi:hypothetical protein
VPDTDKVIDFLTKGNVDETYVARSVLEGVSDYYVPRSEVDSIISLIEKGRARILIHSSLGNGKTLLFTELSTLLHVAGFTFYRFIGSTDGIESDIDFLSSLSPKERTKYVVVIEDAFVFSGTVKMLAFNFSELNLLLTARSAALETRLGSVVDAFGEDYAQFDLNDLTDDEISELDLLLLKHGLWADKQGWKAEKRVKFIASQCRRQLGTVLLSPSFGDFSLTLTR